MSGRLQAIYVKRFKRGPMDPRDAAILIAGQGLLGNANKGGRRQVILLDEEAWADAVAELGVALDPATRRANLLVSGVRLEGTRGRTLRIGPTLLRIWSPSWPQRGPAPPLARRRLCPGRRSNRTGREPSPDRDAG